MANNQKTSTSTQIRNFYSDGMSYLNVSFYNTNLSLKFCPFISKDNMGRSTFDLKNGQSTTIDFERASALSQIADDIIDGKVNELDLPIECLGGSLDLHRGPAADGTIETVLTLTKNGMTIPFRFKTMTYQVKENGQTITKILECGLKAFKSTVDGYLTGINADRHLDKLTDDYIKLQEANNPQQPQQQQRNNNNYRNNNYNNGYKKNYNNNNYQNNRGGWNNNNQQQQSQQQNMSTYTLPR